MGRFCSFLGLLFFLALCNLGHAVEISQAGSTKIQPLEAAAGIKFPFGSATIIRKLTFREAWPVKIGMPIVTADDLISHNSKPSTIKMLDNYSAVVVNMYAKSENFSKDYLISSVASAEGCMDYLCTSDNVRLASGLEGKVRGFYQNGDLLLDLTYLQSDDIRSPPVVARIPRHETIGLNLGCNAHFCVGDELYLPERKYSPDGPMVTVKFLLNNGAMLVEDKSGIAFPSAESMQLAGPSCPDFVIREICLK